MASVNNTRHCLSSFCSCSSLWFNFFFLFFSLNKWQFSILQAQIHFKELMRLLLMIALPICSVIRCVHFFSFGNANKSIRKKNRTDFVTRNICSSCLCFFVFKHLYHVSRIIVIRQTPTKIETETNSNRFKYAVEIVLIANFPCYCKIVSLD